MKIKRYFATDMRQAIQMVREAQGPDAVILSNRRVDGGIEIVAAMDYDEKMYRSLSGDGETPPVQPKATGKQPQIEWSQDPALMSMRDEITLLRGVIESQLNGIAWKNMKEKHPQQAKMLERLLQLGLHPDLCRTLADKVPYTKDMNQNWRRALTLLASKVTVTNDDILNRGGIVALLGPAGAGKTTSVAKLAARYTLRHGPNRVALVTTDSYRIGAHQQLRTYGQILGAPVHVAKDGEELRSILQTLRDKQLVLIDTAGMSQRDIRLGEQFGMLHQSGLPIRSYAVLSASSQRSSLDEVLRSFGKVKLEGAILTKMDETMVPGEALSVVVQNRLPVAYVSDGQRVPEDLHPGRSNNLVNRCVQQLQQLPEKPAEERLVMEFGRLAG
jgi:flagellar biosynthesis protein FlhF